MRKYIIFLCLATTLISTGILSFLEWRSYVRENQATQTFREIKALSLTERKAEALHRLVNERPLHLSNALKQDWNDLEVTLVIELKDMLRCEVLVNRDPNLLR